MVVLYIFLLLLVVSLVLWPYIRIVFLRWHIVHKLEKLCRKGDMELEILNNKYAFAKNERAEFDLVITVGSTVIPIKLYSSFMPHSVLYFDATGRGQIRQKCREPLSADGERAERVIKQATKLPIIKARRETPKKVKLFPVFLNEPSFDSVRLCDASSQKELLGTEHLACGAHWMRASMLLSLLNSHILRKSRGADENK